MKELLSLTEVRQLTEDVENGVSPVLITGVSPVHRAQVEAALHLKTRQPLPSPHLPCTIPSSL